jgi:hypothetical protein
VKQKGPARANPKAAAEELARSWEALLARHSKPLEKGAVSKGLKVKKLKKSAPLPVTVVTRQASFEGMKGVGAKKQSIKYTGTEMLGIGQLHKSNAVPVFKKSEAIELSQMRRG